jgi:dipeptidyl aminopeptidase/acylaminoacyl peptidase
VIALAGDSFGGDCAVTGSALPARFVGLAGSYDVSQLTEYLPSFFGTRYEDDSAPWEDGSAFFHIGGNPELRVLLVHGTEDEVVPIYFSEQLGGALEAAGYAVEIEILEGVNHTDTHDPDVVEDLITEMIAG